MSKVLVINHVSLDGVMQTPGRILGSGELIHSAFATRADR
jgi:hypothetical protein